MKGRPPISAEIKRMRHAARGLNENEPRHDPLDEATPDELTDPKAREEWQRLAGALARGHVQMTERVTLIAYCQKYGEWLKVQAAADSEPVLVEGSHGGKVLNPLRNAASRAYYLLIKAAQELGLTPATRSRIIVRPRDPEHAVDEFSNYQKQRQRKRA
jgi:P27 family predicted phage terminase small subunit